MGAPAATIGLGVLAGGAVSASGGALIPALLAASTAMTVAGTIQAGMAQEQEAKYQAQVAENNAIRATQAADEARIRGEITEQQHRIRVNQAMGQARAVAASRGVLVDQGSALDLTSDIAAVGELDAQMIRRDSTMEQQQLMDRSNQFTAEAGLERDRASFTREATTINAASGILSGSATVADKWYSFKRAP